MLLREGSSRYGDDGHFPYCTLDLNCRCQYYIGADKSARCSHGHNDRRLRLVYRMEMAFPNNTNKISQPDAPANTMGVVAFAFGGVDHPGTYW